jgi:hypothetical protein
MRPSAYYDRVVDVTEELVKFTLLLRERADYLVDRYSERKESAAELSEAREPALDLITITIYATRARCRRRGRKV